MTAEDEKREHWWTMSFAQVSQCLFDDTKVATFWLRLT